jgi:hypothetical protein
MTNCNASEFSAFNSKGHSALKKARRMTNSSDEKIPAFAGIFHFTVRLSGSLQSAQHHQQDDDAQRHSEQPQNNRHNGSPCF